MRIPRVASACAATVVAGSVLTAPAQADDFYYDESFTVERVAANRTSVAVNGLWTAPVTITLTTRLRPGEKQPAGGGDDYMTLSDRDYPEEQRQFYVPLKRVSTNGAVSTWQGVARLTGPSRTVHLTSVHNCLITKDGNRCTSFYYSTPLAKPVTVHVRATNTPVITMDRRDPVGLNHRAYLVSGRVLSTSARPFSRVRLVVGRGAECNIAGRGVATRTDTRGHFSVLVTNRLRASIGEGQPLTHEHCVRVTSSARDSANRPMDLATLATPYAWTTPIPITAPTKVTRGKEAAVWTRPTLLHVWAGLQLERLSGRTWHELSYGHVGASGRGVVRFTPTTLGKGTYRLRVHGTDVTSPTFVMTTTS